MMVVMSLAICLNLTLAALPCSSFGGKAMLSIPFFGKVRFLKMMLQPLEYSQNKLRIGTKCQGRVRPSRHNPEHQSPNW